MIYCKRTELARYLGLSDELDRAIRFVLGLEPARLRMGRNEVSGDDAVYANRFDYATQPAEALLYETHLRYADLHMLLSGREVIYVAPEGTLERLEHKADEDFIGSQGAWQSACRMTAENALLVFPGEAHKVKCVDGVPCQVEKLVIKIREGACAE